MKAVPSTRRQAKTTLRPGGGKKGGKKKKKKEKALLFYHSETRSEGDWPINFSHREKDLIPFAPEGEEGGFKLADWNWLQEGGRTICYRFFRGKKKKLA